MSIETEAISQLKALVKLWDETRKHAGVNSGTNWVTLEAALVATLKGPWSDQVANGISGARADLNKCLGGFREALMGVLRYWASGLASPDLSPNDEDAQLLARIYERLVTSSQTVQSRGITYATPSAGGGNLGTGAIKRLTLDRYNYPLENVYLDAQVAKCVNDSNTTTERGREEFEFRGSFPNKDVLILAGSGALKTIRAKNASDSYLNDPSFDDYDSATTPTRIGKWSPGSSFSNFEIDTTNYYRGYGDNSANTKKSLKFKANDKLVQSVADMRQKFSDNVPVYVQIAYNREIAGADGTLRIRVGDSTTTVVLAAQTGWNVLVLGGLDDNWYRQIKENDLTVEVEVSGATVHGLRVDDFLVVSYERYNGTWWCLVGADAGFPASSGKPFYRGDVFTWTDALAAADGKIQNFLFQLGLACLPSSGSPTISDPA